MLLVGLLVAVVVVAVVGFGVLDGGEDAREEDVVAAAVDADHVVAERSDLQD